MSRFAEHARWLFAAAVVCCMAVAGCSKSGQSKAGAKGAICVGGEWITHEEIARTAEAFRAGTPGAPTTLFEAPDSAKSLREAAKQLIMHRIMLNEVRGRGFVADSARVGLMYGNIKRRFPDEATFQREMTRQGQTGATLRRQIEEGLLVDSLLKSVSSSLGPVTPEECRRFYDENPLKFSVRSNMRLSQIYIPVAAGASPADKQAARKRTEEIVKQLQSGVDFGALAREKSRGPEASSQGDMGWFSEGDLSPVFAKPAKALAKGQVSGIVESERGYHILKKTDEKLAAAEPFEKARPQILVYLQMKRSNERLKAFMDSLVAAAKITYADTAFAHVL